MNKPVPSPNAVAMSAFSSTPSRLTHWLRLCALGTSGLLAATSASAVPGVPQAPTVLFSENFQNLDPATSGYILTDYTGATGQTYTADTEWLTSCNGLLSSGDQPVAGADGQTTSCSGAQASWNATQQLAQALGTYKGQAAPEKNFAVSAYTSANPGAGKIEFATVNPIALPSAGRFVASAIDVGAMNCDFASAPLLQFYMLDGASAIPAGSQINGCASTTVINMAALGTASASTARIGTYRSGSALISAAAVGIRMTNANGSGAGNDHAFDNIELIDVTPTLDKSFNPASQPVNQSSTLTFTITNTTELGAKAGWSFTDHLPTGLVVAATPAESTNCPNGAVTAAADSTSIAVTGDLSDGMTSCTINVNVTSARGGSYQNGPGNIESAGLNPPQPATVAFIAPAPTAVPVDASWALLLLSSMLAGFAGLRLNRRR